MYTKLHLLRVFLKAWISGNNVWDLRSHSFLASLRRVVPFLSDWFPCCFLSFCGTYVTSWLPEGDAYSLRLEVTVDQWLRLVNRTLTLECSYVFVRGKCEEMKFYCSFYWTHLNIMLVTEKVESHRNLVVNSSACLTITFNILDCGTPVLWRVWNFPK